ncbi:hypothetical protein IUY40_00920 [Flavobacterium sp. ALJ2]|uniref:hypothetical protein n=1 Tax=Flavobacterium sp. ALJ2 TaxID=2786960 RepID=UPI00189E1400|nr:hypothetical protein [Flavobacterium sp. ALJ2]MBF7090103.1 hypothetical protein [Flavobacterium sp. ALJ2]
MDNYLLDDYIQCSRLKKKRQKKRLVKEDFEKQLIQLDKLEGELWKKKRCLPLVPLATPYQKGWQRYFVLREDIARSKEALFYKTVLEKINTVQYSSDKSFKKKKKRKRKHVYVEKLQTLKEFSESEWRSPKLALTEKEKTHFYKRERWCPNCKRYKVHYVFNEPWRYVLRVRPNMITHTKMVDAVLESEIDRIENYLIRNFLRNTIMKMKHGSVNNWRWRENKQLKYQNPLDYKQIHTVMDEYYKEKEYLNSGERDPKDK